MSDTIRALRAAVLLAGPIFAAETKLNFDNLPPAVQAAVKKETKGANLAGISKEIEKGKTMYEVETKVNGRTRNLLFDANGALAEIEEQVALDSLPAAAVAAIEKRAAGKTVTKVEKLTAGSHVSYEATFKTKNGKTKEVGVNADGSAHREE